MKSTIFLGFDAQATPAVEWMGEKKPLIDNGVHPAMVTSAVRKFTKQCVACWFWLLTFTILSGKFKGRCLTARYNIVNDSPQAEEIGRGQLRHLLDCIGNITPQCEADLCGIPILITVETRKTNFTGRNGEEVEAEVNEIVRIEPYSPEPPVVAADDDDEPMPF